MCVQVKILSREWWGKCRMVDRVQLAGAGDSRRRVYELWTCDHHNQSVRRRTNSVAQNTGGWLVASPSDDLHTSRLHATNVCARVCVCLLLVCLQIIADKRYKFFLSAFRTAVLLYVQGHWDACKDKLEECLQLKVRMDERTNERTNEQTAALLNPPHNRAVDFMHPAAMLTACACACACACRAPPPPQQKKHTLNAPAGKGRS